ncbi:hypothetical protein N7523_008735 [Penicillium sp. IBT 18751x]|nr:hypothetical protein N7523_008735 [Penicillium sp. IBT 18751x]
MAVFEVVHETLWVNKDTMRARYQEILEMSIFNASTEEPQQTTAAKDSHSSSRRFSWILPLKIVMSIIYWKYISGHYGRAPGLPKILWRHEKKVIFITEGLADGQKWTVREMGVSPWINILMTTNAIGTSKVDGLFGVVLEKYVMFEMLRPRKELEYSLCFIMRHGDVS